MNRDFWRDRRVLITGHTGFKGAWLSSLLLARGARVTGLALPPATATNLFDLLGLQARMDSMLGDIRDASTVQEAVTKSRPEVVFHMAAQALVRASYERPVETFQTNIMGTVHVLEALRHSNDVRAAVVVTSDKCYQNREWFWPYRETESLGGEDPYSSSKAGAELVTHAYRASYADLPATATARAGNVIGGGDWSRDRLVPDVVAAALDKRPPTLRYPSAIRPWQHVLEPLHGYVMLAERLFEGSSAAEAWNFGPADDGATVAQLTELLLAALDRPTTWTLQSGEQSHEAAILRVDSSKARRLLGWKSKLGSAATIEWTAHWYRAWADGERVAEVTQRQITEYEAL